MDAQIHAYTQAHNLQWRDNYVLLTASSLYKKSEIHGLLDLQIKQ